MRILQLIQQPQLRGAEIFAAQLSSHLEREGQTVLLVSLFKGNATLPFSGQQLCLERNGANRFLDFAGWRRLANVIRDFKPDIVQANAGDTLKFAALSRLLFGWKTPLIYRNANKISGFMDSWLKRVYNSMLVKQVSQVISVSEECRKDFVLTFDYPTAHTAMVSIGVEPLPPNSQDPSDLVDLFRKRIVIAHVASFVPEKNHLGVLRIVELLVVRHPSLLCVLVGDGKLRPFIEAEIRKRKLESHIYIAGYRVDAQGIMAQASVVILPSLIEGLPGVLLEAMQVGTPVVAYQVGGIAEVVQHGETGWLVPLGNEAAFVLAADEALDDAKRAGVSQAARSLVEQQFKNRDKALAFLSVYTRVVRPQA